MTILI